MKAVTIMLVADCRIGGQGPRSFTVQSQLEYSKTSPENSSMSEIVFQTNAFESDRLNGRSNAEYDGITSLWGQATSLFNSNQQVVTICFFLTTSKQ